VLFVALERGVQQLAARRHLCEDRVQVKNGNQAQIMGKLRCFSMNLLRWQRLERKIFKRVLRSLRILRVFDFHA